MKICVSNVCRDFSQVEDPAAIYMLASTIMSWRCAEWFMDLPDPTSQQSAFVSVVVGAMTGVFGIWMGHEHK